MADPAQVALLRACEQCSPDKVKLCLDATSGAQLDLNLPDADGRVMLHVACAHVASDPDGAQAIMTALLEEGADAGASSHSGTTALLLAADLGSVEAVRLLHDAGASVTVSDGNRRTALHLAAVKNHMSLADVLVGDMGCDAEAKDRKGKTPADLAAEEGHEEMVELLAAAAKGGGGRRR